MPRRIRSLLLAPLLALSTACAVSAVPGPSMQTIANMNHAAAGARTASDLLGPTEISLSPGGSAYDVLQRLRPQFLNRQAAPVRYDPYGGRPVVYLDGVRLGGVEELRSISSVMVGEVRFLSAASAHSRFGYYHPGGVIAISSRP